MKSEEIIYQKVCVSPRPPPKIFYKGDWMNDLDSDFAENSKERYPTNRTQTQYPIM